MECYKGIKSERNKHDIRFGQLKVIDDLGNSSYKRLVEKETQVKNNDKRIKDNYITYLTELWVP